MTKIKLKMVDLRLYALFEKLLKQAQPKREKRHYLSKLLMQENEDAAEAHVDIGITQFYRLPYSRRTAGQFRRIFKIKPYPWLLGEFFLTFRTAAISDTQIFQTATALRHMLANVIEMPEAIGSTEFLHLVTYHTVKPRPDQRATGISLKIFINRWQQQAQRKFGDTYDQFFKQLRETMNCPEPEAQQGSEPSLFKSDFLAPIVADPDVTQGDLEWMKNLVTCINEGLKPPLHPLESGPKVPVLLRIEKLVRAARKHYPFRHRPLEDAVLKTCNHYLNTYGQPADKKLWLVTR